MAKLGLYLKLFYYLLKLSKNPENTPVVLKMSPILIRLGFMENSLKVIQPYEAELNSSNYRLQPIDLNRLKNLPTGTLGSVYAHHMLSNNLDPNFYGELKAVGDGARFIFRLRQTHDLWHVITGFSTSIEDELGLQAFLYAQVRSPLSPVLIGAAFLKAGLSNNPHIHTIFERISLGWKTGCEAKNIYSLDWDANWSTPIDELRNRYNLKAVTPSFIDVKKAKEGKSSLNLSTTQGLSS